MAFEVDPQAVVKQWKLGDWQAILAHSPYNRRPWLTMIGPGGPEGSALSLSREGGGHAPVLAAWVCELVQGEAAISSGVSVPPQVMALLPDQVRPQQFEDWTWWWTTDAPPVVAGESRVDLLSVHDARIPDLLQHSPSVYLRPGDGRDVAWCGIEGDDARLLACLTVEEHRPGVPHLASVVVAPDVRGGGLGTALCAAVVRERRNAGLGAATLGMMTTNDVGRALYSGLGFRAGHRFQSGWLPETRLIREPDEGVVGE